MPKQQLKPPGGAKKAEAGKLKKAPARPRGPSKRDLEARALGKRMAVRFKPGERWPTFKTTKGIRRGAIESLLEDEKIKGKKQFASAYRGVGPDMDELISTSSTREIVTGLLGEKKWSEYTREERAYLGELVDLMSAIRAPTRYVGYSLGGEKMQHPTSRPEAYFTDPHGTMSKHSELDNARRDYIEREATRVYESGGSAREIVLAAGRAAIEFTLNNFMAPVSASNVHSFSLKSGAKVTDETILEQVKWREFLKDFYVDVLGGTLRPSTGPETDEESLVRAWYQQASDYSSLPPSPKRSTDPETWQKKPSAPAQEIEMDVLVPRATALQQSGANVFGQTVSNANDNLSNANDNAPMSLATPGSASSGSGNPLSDTLATPGPDPGSFGPSSIDPYGSNMPFASLTGSGGASSPLKPGQEIEMKVLPIE